MTVSHVSSQINFVAMLLEVFSLVSRVAIIFLSILHQHAKELPVESLEINIRNALNKQLKKEEE